MRSSSLRASLAPAGAWWLACAIAVAVVAALVLTAGDARAERVRTTESTKVYKRTGEQSDVVTRVAKGTTLQVVATQGRWLKVRVNGRTGWVMRTSVESLGPATLPRNTRRRPFVDGRSLRRDESSDAPEDRVGGDAIDGEGDGREVRGGDDDDDDDRDGDRRKPARDDRDDDRDDRRKPARDERDDRDDGDRRKPARDDRDDDRDRRKPARDDRDDRERGAGGDDIDLDLRGDDGDGDDEEEEEPAGPPTLTVRVARAELFERPSDSADPVLTLREGDRVILLEEHRSGRWLRVEVADDDAVSGYLARDAVGSDDDDDGATGPARRAITASARLGFASIGGTFRSDGAMLAAGPPSEYPFGSGAVALSVGAEATFPIKPRILVGGSVRYLGCVGTPGIAFAGQNVGFTTHDLDLLAIGGYDLRGRRGLTVFGRAGLHFGRFSVSDLANPARLPVETLLGPVVGAEVRVRRVTRRVGVHASVDLMPTGKREQTKNQGDGQLAATRSLWLQLSGTYAWRTHWRLDAGYQLGYAATRWVGSSDRHMNATGATRSDLAHLFSVGATRPF